MRNEILVDRKGLELVIDFLRDQAASIRDAGSYLPESKKINPIAELEAQKVESLIKGLFKEDPWDQVKKEAPHLWETEQEV